MKADVATVKLFHGGDIRRLPLPSSLRDLRALASSVLGLPAEGLTVKYVDDENDLITMATEEDLTLALALRRGSPLKVHVFARALPLPEEAAAALPSAPPAVAPSDERSTVPRWKALKWEAKEAKKGQKRDWKAQRQAWQQEGRKHDEPRPIPPWKEQTLLWKAEKARWRAEQDPGGACGGRGGRGRGRWRPTAPCVAQPPPRLNPDQDLDQDPDPDLDQQQAMPEAARPKYRFVKSEAVDDGSCFPPGAAIVKAWRIRNCGTVPFPGGVVLMPVGRNSDRMGSPEVLRMPGADGLAPEAEAVVSINLLAPAGTGEYEGYWKLGSADGAKFGQRLRCRINVVNPDSSSESSSSSSSCEEEKPLMTEERGRDPTPADSFGEHEHQRAAAHAAVERQLQQMGFANQRLNAKLTRKFDGDLTRIVNRLLVKQQKQMSRAQWAS